MFGAAKLGWHDLRRTFATLADQLGLSIGERQALMGHSRAAQTRDRTYTASEQAKAALEQLAEQVKGPVQGTILPSKPWQPTETKERAFGLRSKRSAVRIGPGVPAPLIKSTKADPREVRLLFETKLPGRANLITYMGKDGQQYVVITAQETVVAYRLP